MKKWLHLGLRLFLFAVIFFVGVLIINTITFSSKQLQVSPVSLAPIPDKALDRLSAVIQIPTVSSPERVDSLPFRRLDSLLQQQFPGAMKVLERQEVPGLSIVYKWPGKNPKLDPILLTGHLDVVPASKQNGWEYEPFEGKLADGFVWGRGTLDDKMQVTALLECVDLLQAEGYYPQRSVYFAFGHDEEMEGRDGAQQIAAFFKASGIRFDYVLDEGSIILEEALTGLKAPLAMIGVGEKGNGTYTITAALQDGGHSSMPPDETVITLLAKSILKLQEHPFPARIDGAVAAFFRYVGPEMSWFQKMIMANLWCTDGLIIRQLKGDPAANAMIRTTVAPTIIQGGIRENVLPFRAYVKVNLRLHPGETVESARAYMERVINDPRVQVQESEGGRNEEPSPLSSTDSFGFDVIRKTIYEVFPGVKVAPSLVIATTDARHYVGLSDHVYRFMPLQVNRADLKRIHGINERVGAQEYKKMISFYQQLIRNSCK